MYIYIYSICIVLFSFIVGKTSSGYMNHFTSPTSKEAFGSFHRPPSSCPSCLLVSACRARKGLKAASAPVESASQRQL